MVGLALISRLMGRIDMSISTNYDAVGFLVLWLGLKIVGHLERDLEKRGVFLLFGALSQARSATVLI